MPKRVVGIFTSVAVAVAGLVLADRTAMGVDPAPVALPSVVPSELEPNDTAPTANPLTVPTARVTGGWTAGDADLYSFTASAGNRVFAHVTTGPFFASGDSVLAVLEPDGASVLEEDADDGTFGPFSSSIAGIEIPSTGTYFLRVTGAYPSDDFAPYTLYFTLGTALTNEAESNNTRATANAAAHWIAGTLSDFESDFYSVSLDAGDTVTASIDLHPSRSSPADTDASLQLEASGTGNGTVTAVDGFSASPHSRALAMTVKDSGTYFIEVSANGLGPYYLSIATFDGDTVNCRSYAAGSTAIPDGGSMSSTITVPDDFRIGRSALAVNITHPATEDLDVVMSSPSDNEIVLMDDLFHAGDNVNVLFDDHAALSLDSLNTFMQSGAMSRPEGQVRLDWLEGVQSAGDWTIDIHDQAATNTGMLNSWTLILCEEAIVPLEHDYLDANFDATGGGFIAAGEWERGVPTLGPFTSCAGGSAGCFKTDLDGAPSDTSHELKSPPVDLRSTSGDVALQWSHRFSVDSAPYTRLSVQVREVGVPSSAVTLYRTFAFTGMKRSIGNPAVEVHQSSGWSRMAADVSSFAGKRIEVLFVLDWFSGIAQTRGAAIDDVRVSAENLPSDADGDEVPDHADNCGQTPPGSTVDADGCAASQLDDDGDGVTNDVDLCADTEADDTLDANGCTAAQRDDDGDGLLGGTDFLCPSTGNGETVAANGCSVQDARTDLMIKGPKDTSTTGDGTYNDDPAQTVIAKTKRGKTTIFTINFENEGRETQDLTFFGCGSSKGFKVSYWEAGVDITDTATSESGHTFSDSPPTSMSVLQMHVKVGKRGPGTKACAARVASSLHPAAGDSVIGVVKVKR